MPLIHKSDSFELETLMKRAQNYGFPNIATVAMFAWDYELAAQFQTHSDSIILKGGAATQVQLPLDMQRGSIDIDLIAPINETDLAQIITKIQTDIMEVQFVPYQPREPNPKLPMITYWVQVPTIIDEVKRTPLQIKTDILMEDLKLPT
ncbi:MAG: hypothetical protein ACRD5H_17540, partial [Nitrososphaerales archaeon]